ncbi:MAG: antitoxin family protein [Candidatus Methylomirabilales bacterium]
MTKLSPRIIDAVHEDGVFRPTRKVGLPERSRVRLTLVPLPARSAKERNLVVERQRKALLGIAGIGAGGLTWAGHPPSAQVRGRPVARETPELRRRRTVTQERMRAAAMPPALRQPVQAA